MAFSQAAIGVGLGMLIGEKLGKSTRQRLAGALIGAGVAAIVPFVAGVVTTVSNRPGSSRGMKKRLESIREQDSGFVNEEDTF